MTQPPTEHPHEIEVTASHSRPTTTDPTNPAVSTVHMLQTRIARLEILLGVFRRLYADLVAAGRAALVAHADGEPDPWSYLRDELPPPPPGHPLHRDGPRYAHDTTRGGR